MRITVLGIMITAVLIAPPAFAQYGSSGNASTPDASATKDNTWGVAKRVKQHVEGYKQKKHAAKYGSSGNASTPDASVTKDYTWSVAKRTKQHVEGYKQKKHIANGHRAKAMNSEAPTTGSGSSSAPGARTNKDDPKPKAQ